MPETDCLVLRIEYPEYMDLFILFDIVQKSYYLCGKKTSVSETDEPSPFSFFCKQEDSLLHFIDVIIDVTINTRLYNLNSLPLSCNNISFDLLNRLAVESSEIISSIDDSNYYGNLQDYLRMLKNIRND
jgi:hypothetical protein